MLLLTPLHCIRNVTLTDIGRAFATRRQRDALRAAELAVNGTHVTRDVYSKSRDRASTMLAANDHVVSAEAIVERC